MVQTRSVLLSGDRSLLAVAHRIIARQAMVAVPPVVIDCGGVFNPYGVAEEARRHQVPPQAVLERIMICRAFTGYQELHALRRVARLAPGQRLYLLNPLHVLLDEDLPAADRPWLFNRLLAGLDFLGDRGDWVRICQPPVSASPLPEGAGFLRALERRYPIILARDGRLQVSTHGQVGIPLQPRHRPGRGRVRAVPPHAA